MEKSNYKIDGEAVYSWLEESGVVPENSEDQQFLACRLIFEEAFELLNSSSMTVRNRMQEYIQKNLNVLSENSTPEQNLEEWIDALGDLQVVLLNGVYFTKLKEQFAEKVYEQIMEINWEKLPDSFDGARRIVEDNSHLDTVIQRTPKGFYCVRDFKTNKILKPKNLSKPEYSEVISKLELKSNNEQ